MKTGIVCEMGEFIERRKGWKTCFAADCRGRWFRGADLCAHA